MMAVSLLIALGSSLVQSQPLPQNRILVQGSYLPIEEFLSRYIYIPSLSGQEQEACNFLRSVCQENGLYIEDMSKTNRFPNFAASIYPLDSGKPNIIFLNHMDVVPIENESEWEHPPFSGDLVNGEVWGRGALDMKGPAACQLFAILRFAKQMAGTEAEFNVTFLAVASEELNFEHGAGYVVDHFLSRLNSLVVIGEGPTVLSDVIKRNPHQEVCGIAVADKRPVRVDLELHQRSFFGHSSVMQESYPIKDLVKALNQILTRRPPMIYNETNLQILSTLGNLEGGIQELILNLPYLFKPLIANQLRNEPEFFSLFSNTINLIDIDLISSANNKIADRVTCSFDVRLMPGISTQQFLSELKEDMGRKEVELYIVDSMPPSNTSPHDNVFFENMKQSIIEQFPGCHVVPVIHPATTDGIYFRFHNIPTYGIIPARLGLEYIKLIHNRNERIPVKALEEATEVYYHFIHKFTLSLNETHDERNR